MIRRVFSYYARIADSVQTTSFHPLLSVNVKAGLKPSTLGCWSKCFTTVPPVLNLSKQPSFIIYSLLMAASAAGIVRLTLRGWGNSSTNGLKLLPMSKHSFPHFLSFGVSSDGETQTVNLRTIRHVFSCYARIAESVQTTLFHPLLCVNARSLGWT